MRADTPGEGGGNATMIQVELRIPDLGFGIIDGRFRALQRGLLLTKPRGRLLLVHNPARALLIQPPVARRLLLCEHQRRLRVFYLCGCGLKLRVRLRQPDFVGTWIDGEEEIALVDDVAIFEMYLCKRAADLSSEFDLLDR